LGWFTVDADSAPRNEQLTEWKASSPDLGFRTLLKLSAEKYQSCYVISRLCSSVRAVTLYFDYSPNSYKYTSKM
jgi:hypothetical protein